MTILPTREESPNEGRSLVLAWRGGGAWVRIVANRKLGKVAVTVSARSQATAASKSKVGLVLCCIMHVQSREAKVDQ